jgi:hypothetical protein
LEVGDDSFELLATSYAAPEKDWIRTVASKLTKDRDNTVAHETVSCRAVVE